MLIVASNSFATDKLSPMSLSIKSLIASFLVSADVANLSTASQTMRHDMDHLQHKNVEIINETDIEATLTVYYVVKTKGSHNSITKSIVVPGKGSRTLSISSQDIDKQNDPLLFVQDVTHSDICGDFAYDPDDTDFDVAGESCGNGNNKIIIKYGKNDSKFRNLIRRVIFKKG